MDEEEVKRYRASQVQSDSVSKYHHSLATEMSSTQFTFLTTLKSNRLFQLEKSHPFGE